MSESDSTPVGRIANPSENDDAMNADTNGFTIHSTDQTHSVAPYLWMLGGAFAFSLMTTLAHFLRDRFSWQAIAIGRASVPFVLTALSAWWVGGRLVVLGPPAALITMVLTVSAEPLPKRSWLLSSVRFPS